MTTTDHIRHDLALRYLDHGLQATRPALIYGLGYYLQLELQAVPMEANKKQRVTENLTALCDLAREMIAFESCNSEVPPLFARYHVT